MTLHNVLIGGRWRPAVAAGTFQAADPATREPLEDAYPVSGWEDCEEALNASAAAAEALRRIAPERIAGFLEIYADRIERRKEALVEMAVRETALPATPRLADVELPRTTGQLRQAAAAARDGSWALPTIDSPQNIRSCYAALGPVCVFGPNNFPFAFGSISGGDFAAAIAAGNPVIAKANSSHPGVTRLLAEEAAVAEREAELPPGAVQLIYRTSHEDGQRLVADPRLGATGYTGSRAAGLRLKAAADRVGKPIYLELSSVNPVLLLPEALRRRGEEIASEFAASCLLGTGQFCTNPGLVVLIAGAETEAFVASVVKKFDTAAAGTLLSAGVEESLRESVAGLRRAGAQCRTSGSSALGSGYGVANTLLTVSGARFLESPETLQAEAFGNCSLLVIAADIGQAGEVIDSLEGNLTGCVYSDAEGGDEAAYDALAPRLRMRVGRLLNDKMPTGVAVSPAMNHGGPYPATGHPGFTAVGVPASLRRFAMLQCYDNVRPHRLPRALQDANPTGRMWRLIDGEWSQGDVSG